MNVMGIQKQGNGFKKPGTNLILKKNVQQMQMKMELQTISGSIRVKMNVVYVMAMAPFIQKTKMVRL